ncbi:AAA family ATPase [Chryseobacterium sp. AG363]|uniref:AAA family ATPase n=1 Tax=Chryseobacterium sp. AG363 TaxID=2183997 RepID=UPI000E769772|nr:AAA family ATPase [Chryseobacterium sp. AG363]RKE77188.1 AAA domain-containing protein [Chryseobacterium sp. AG363]
MSATKYYHYKTFREMVVRLRDDLNNHDFVLLYAYNGTGKTRLSMEFKDYAKTRKKNPGADTLYFNAYTEDLFSWDNDLDNDTERVLKINAESKFFSGLKDLALEERIFAYLERYASFDFKIDYDKWNVIFSKEVKNPNYKNPDSGEPELIKIDHIKVSRGEENIFIWCLFLAICELVIEGHESYNWVKNIYIDDPISSLDDNNAIAVASDLAHLIKKAKDKVNVVISSHHALFFNVMSNELRQHKTAKHFLHKNGEEGHTIRATDDTPFFHHVAILSELKQVVDSGKINTYHFNMLRSVLEKTATFFGYDDFSKCIYGVDDDVLFARALNLLSHGKYSIYEPKEMGDDNKDLFRRIFNAFYDKYQFELPELLIEQSVAEVATEK